MSDDRRWTWVGAGGVLVALTVYGLSILAQPADISDRPGAVGSYTTGDFVLHGILVCSLGVSGAWLVARRHRHPIGWILMASGLLQAVNSLSSTYAVNALTDPDRSLPLGKVALWFAQWTWVPAVLLVATVLPPLYPSGRTTTVWWTRHVRAALVGMILICIAFAFGDPADDIVKDQTWPWSSSIPEWLPFIVLPPAALLLVPVLIASVIGTLIRTFRARPPERQQLLWLVATTGPMVPLAFLDSNGVFGYFYAAVPIAIAVGVLRYGALGVDQTLRRTLLYLPLTVLVALTVGLSTQALARLLPEGPLPLLIGSALVAALVLPVAGWLRGRVDRFVLGDGADPMALVERLSLAEGDAVAALLEAVATASGASSVEIRDLGGQLVAAVGDSPASAEEVDLVHAGCSLGTMRVGPRAGELRLTTRDRNLMRTLAPHVAVVLRSAQLNAELELARLRVARATMAERDRLRRDLHDGLGPSLSGIALGLEAAELLLNGDASGLPRARILLARTRQESESAVLEVRRVLDGLRPSALDERGLAGAVQDTALSLGLVGGRTRFDLETTAFDLPPAVEEAAFRIVAESMTNVVRHARASGCRVELLQDGSALHLRVEDDGDGIAERISAGHGLESIRRRAAEVGGQLDIARREPRGTTVRAELPLGAQ